MWWIKRKKGGGRKRKRRKRKWKYRMWILRGKYMVDNLRRGKTSSKFFSFYCSLINRSQTPSDALDTLTHPIQHCYSYLGRPYSPTSAIIYYTIIHDSRNSPSGAPPVCSRPPRPPVPQCGSPRKMLHWYCTVRLSSPAHRQPSYLSFTLST
jgi:hypothetical protein